MGKRIFILIVLTIGFITVCLSCSILPIRGNGNIVSSERVVSSFERISSSGSAQVRFHVSSESRVVVTTDSNLIEFVTTTVTNNELRIGTENGNFIFSKLFIDIYYPVIYGVSLSGSGSFNSSDKITVSAFNANISGSGSIKAIIECETFSSLISGSGHVTVSGKNESSNITVSGSGKFNGNEFLKTNAKVIISGSGSANINVTGDLNAAVSGSGSINYRGNPSNVVTNISGSGRINKL